MGTFFGPIGNLFNLIFTFPIFNALMVLYHLIGDFGLAIVVLTLIIKLVLFPLTLQQLKSMRATQALQPQMAEIRRKYAKDQQGQALAMQQLYKEYGINPAAGCLPLLIQMPVLYGLFFALENAVRVNGSVAARLQAINSTLYPFIPHFMHLPNLSLNWFTFLNPAFHFPLAAPDPTHILPILAAIATFVQLRMSQTAQARTQANTGKATDQMTQSMKMMQFVMPIITLFIGWTFPAGLALYWTVSSIFQAVQQYFVTGWGELLTVPSLSLAGILGSGGSTSSNATSSNGTGKTIRNSNYAVDGPKTREVAVADTDEGNDADTEGEGAISHQMRTTTRSNGSASARRRSSNTRRRSSNYTQKRNVSSRSR